MPNVRRLCYSALQNDVLHTGGAKAALVVVNDEHWRLSPKVLSELPSYHSAISHDSIKTANALYPNPLSFPYSQFEFLIFFFLENKLLLFLAKSKL